MEMIADIWNIIYSNNIIFDIMEEAGEQITILVPIGVGLMFVLAAPRVIRRVVGSAII